MPKRANSKDQNPKAVKRPPSLPEEAEEVGSFDEELDLVAPLVKTPSSTIVKQSFSWLPASSLFIKYGQSDDFNKPWLNIAKLGFLLTVRQSLIKKTRHDRSKPKTTQFHVKTQKYGAFKGHLVIPDEWTPKTNPIAIPPGDRNKQEVTAMEYTNENGSTEQVFVTYERQDLRFIQTQIAAGKYKLLDCALHTDQQSGKISSAEIYLEDDNKRTFCVRVWQDELKPQEAAMIADMPTLRAVFEKRKDTEDSGRESKAKIALDKLFKSDLWRDNIDSTAKILPANQKSSGRESRRINRMNIPSEQATWVVDDIPAVVCDEMGIAIKGDIDQRNCIIPIDIPISSLELIDVNANDPNLIPKLIEKINKLYRELKAQNYDDQFLEIVANAVNILDKHLENASDDPFKRNQIVTMMGNIELINAVLVLGLDTVIEHGSDGVSILLPENYQIEHIADMQGEIVHETYGEFDYYSFILAHEDMFAGKLINFNLTEFAKTTHYLDPHTGKPKTRENVDVTVIDNDGVTRRYNNFKDEDLSIKLHILLYERQLLQLKKMNIAKLKEYIKVEEVNYRKMYERALASREFDLASALHDGMAVKRNVINFVQILDKQSIDNRLAEIRELGTVASGENITSSNSSRSSSPTIEPSGSQRNISPKVLAKQKSFTRPGLVRQDSFLTGDKVTKYNQSNTELRARLGDLLFDRHISPRNRDF